MDYRYWHLCYLGLCYSHLSLRLYLRVHYRQHQQHCSDDVESCDVFSCIPDSPVNDGDGDNSTPLSSCSILSLPVSLGELGVTPDVELTPTEGVLGGVVVKSPVLEPLSSTERSLQLLPKLLTKPAALRRSAFVADSMAAANMALSSVVGRPLVASCACFICRPKSSFNIFAELKPLALNRLPSAARAPPAAPAAAAAALLIKAAAVDGVSKGGDGTDAGLLLVV
uniref:Uncharacterized protein n=1 Tax=Glossina pallidipes TaxID=7398 RepID=A0A1A9Z0T0_GLOPL